jgi:beta-glucanase (GH16 family)
MYKKIIIFLCGIFILGACVMKTPESIPIPTSTLAAWDRDDWNIAWHDEFDGAELERTDWTFDMGGTGRGNQEMEAYTDRPENVRLENGMLVIEAREEPDMIAGQHYSSARIKTQGLHAWRYGRIEARIRLPNGQGIWPAFWMLGDNINQVG